MNLTDENQHNECIACMLNRFKRKITFVSDLCAYLSGLLLLVMAAHIILEIVLRTLFDKSTFVLDEFVGYEVAAMTFLSLGHSLDKGALIRVNIITSRIKHLRKISIILEILCSVLTLLISLFIARYFILSVVHNFARGAVSSTIAEVPLCIPEGIILVGILIFSLQMSIHIAIEISAFIQGNVEDGQTE